MMTCRDHWTGVLLFFGQTRHAQPSQMAEEVQMLNTVEPSGSASCTVLAVADWLGLTSCRSAFCTYGEALVLRVTVLWSHGTTSHGVDKQDNGRLCFSRCCQPGACPGPCSTFVGCIQETYVDMASLGPVLEEAFAAAGIAPRSARL